MKKVIYFAALLFGLTLTSCEKEEMGGTATEATAGQWYVSVDAADENGDVVEGLEDPFGMGRVLMLTYNTAANVPNEMIVDDIENFWNFQVKVNCDQNALTFSNNTTENNNLRGDEINVQITNGKILLGAGRQNNGSVADSIVFYVSFSDDEYPAAYGYKNYRVSGVRYSGLTEND